MQNTQNVKRTFTSKISSTTRLPKLRQWNLIAFLWGLYRFWAIILVSFLIIANSGALAQDANVVSSSPSVKADRWIEIDLYWFDRNDIQGSSERFWQRCAPLFEGAEGWRGVILNVGWTADYVMDWRGNLGQTISFPVGFKQQPWFEVGGQLTGDTAERERQWQERFAKQVNDLKKEYGPWTYNDLKKLTTALRQVADHKYGLKGMRIGSLVFGSSRNYDGKSLWAEKHQDAYDRHGYSFNPGCILKEDPTVYGAFPNGIRTGTPVFEFFGKQWGSLSKATGLDAIVLRDGFLLPVSYRRSGLFGAIAPSPEKAEAWNQAAAAMVRITKQSNPRALVLGYSNGASAVSDWRANCVDLESIAKEGYMDAFIDQTWAGAWNEVGLRAQGFWNWPELGWTYQLAYMLIHGAVLADTHVRHYHLTETFDAWESWDVIHTAPERLKWGIWAYSHAAVKTPEGLKMPAGAYISWANQGKRLLSEADVKLLAGTLDAAYRDAVQVKEVYGPTLVYNREAIEWEMAHAAGGRGIKEWLDEQAGTVMKWPVPIMSATRLEWLPKVKSDLFIIQTPVHLSDKSRNIMVSLINSGQPVIAVGSSVDGVDPVLSKLMGIQAMSSDNAAFKTNATPIVYNQYGDEQPCPGNNAFKTNATLAAQMSGITDDLPAAFSTYQWWSKNEAIGDGRPVYDVDESPVLVVNSTNGHHVAFWDPPEFEPLPHFTTPLLAKLGGSVTPYVVVARVANSFLSQVKAIHALEIDPKEPVAVESWRLKNGEVQILAGNLEEGLRDDANLSRHTTLVLSWKNLSLSKISVPGDSLPIGRGGLDGANLSIVLEQAQAALFTLKPVDK